MEKNKKMLLSAIFIAVLLVIVTGLSFAFFNYTRTGLINNIGTGQIYFNSNQGNTLNMTNVFPIKSNQVNDANLDSISINIVGDTTYANGEEYLVSIVDVNNTIISGSTEKTIPISYVASYEATSVATGENPNSVGLSSATYWTSRESKDANIYNLNASGEICDGKQVLVGFIKNDDIGINGTLKISAYIDADKIAITDTYDSNPSVSFSRNPNMSEEELNSCITYVTEEWIYKNYFREGETGEAFCNGTGTSDGATFDETMEYAWFFEEAVDYLVEHNIILMNNLPNGTTRDWVNGRVVFTTTEWNSFQSSGTPISFKIRVESNEGIWVFSNFADRIKGRLGQDGLVAVNTSGDLYTGTGTIREYRYSGIGNYCTYTNGTDNYNISVEGTECPEHAYLYNETNKYIVIGSSDSFSLWGLIGNSVELNRVNTTATESNLKNYVMFNNEKWRIIGVFGDNVKIMKDLPLIEDLTNNPVDTVGLNDSDANTTQIYTNTLNEQYLIKDISYQNNHKYGYFLRNYPGDSNYSYNWNDWTHSGIMYYLNEENTGSYYSTIGPSYKNLIADTTYYLGNVMTNLDSNEWDVIVGTAKEVYVEERGNVSCALIYYADVCNILDGNGATWKGKIGLPYPSDIAYATITDKWSTNAGDYYHNGGSLNNWMYNTDTESIDLISPTTYEYTRTLKYDNCGALYSGRSYTGHSIRPTLNLVSEAEVVDGDGSYSNPYILNIK